MTVHEVTIAMNGVTGRMGTNQHLVRSILAIRAHGGVDLRRGDRIWPEPVLVGRDEGKLRHLAKEHGLDRWSVDLDETLADPGVHVYFDAQATSRRAGAVRKALEAGKDIYCEKPLAENAATALELARQARRVGAKNGIVQDKLFLPGLRKLRRVIDSGFFGRILSVRCAFGYWVFEGFVEPAQRPSWNYRKEDGGGIVLDMFPHWQYILENLFAPVRSLVCHATTHVPERVDENGRTYEATADDAAYAVLELHDGIVALIDSSWTTRVRRDDLVVFQVDGTDGSAVVGLRDCWVQHRSNTPRLSWNPDLPNPTEFRANWLEVPAAEDDDNAFKVQWERYLRHVVVDEPFPWDFLAGARGVQLAELALRSGEERRWVDVPELRA
ncbi:MAG: Gfo/Idh/MocA family protein [Acidimicrobiales bacterium]